jgi:hypothetical protein
MIHYAHLLVVYHGHTILLSELEGIGINQDARYPLKWIDFSRAAAKPRDRLRMFVWHQTHLSCRESSAHSLRLRLEQSFFCSFTVLCRKIP